MVSVPLLEMAEDRTPFHREPEIALAHTIGSETERAYRRGNSLDKRRELMNSWAAYCELPPEADNVIPMERKPVSA
jgi:hypothetical protein